MATIKITQIKSKINAPKHQKLVLAALGLKKIHQTVEKEDNAAIRGMVDQVKQLVSVE
ncbi:MAG: 50S ribosomal protein L30 [Bacteroidales bacterium]|nr:50S ribosomal protein L30 [Bacteroidales bacterium]